jgi:hypothetical protein
MKLSIESKIFDRGNKCYELQMRFEDEFGTIHELREVADEPFIAHCEYAIDRMFELLKRRVKELPVPMRKILTVPNQAAYEAGEKK